MAAHSWLTRRRGQAASKLGLMLDLQPAPLTRRALAVAGSGLGMVALGAVSVDAKKKNRKKKRKKKPFFLVAADMTGAKEVDPNPGDPLGSGSAEFTIKSNGTICATFTFETTTPDSVIQMTHIHQGEDTVNGPVVIDFHGKLSECVPIGKALASQIKANPAGFYANIHTNNFTGGAVRDQLAKKA